MLTGRLNRASRVLLVGSVVAIAFASLAQGAGAAALQRACTDVDAACPWVGEAVDHVNGVLPGGGSLPSLRDEAEREVAESAALAWDSARGLGEAAEVQHPLSNPPEARVRLSVVPPLDVPSAPSPLDVSAPQAPVGPATADAPPSSAAPASGAGTGVSSGPLGSPGEAFPASSGRSDEPPFVLGRVQAWDLTSPRAAGIPLGSGAEEGAGGAPAAPLEVSAATRAAVPADVGALARVGAFFGFALALVGAIFAIPAFRLYYELERDRLFENERRREVFALVGARPGITAARIARELGLAYNTVRHHLDVLGRFGCVGVRAIGENLRYFPVAACPAPEEARVLRILAREENLRFLRLLATGSCSTRATAGVRLGLAKSTVSRRVRILSEAGLLSEEDGILSLTPAGGSLLGRVGPVEAVAVRAPALADVSGR